MASDVSGATVSSHTLKNCVPIINKFDTIKTSITIISVIALCSVAVYFNISAVYISSLIGVLSIFTVFGFSNKIKSIYSDNTLQYLNKAVEACDKALEVITRLKSENARLKSENARLKSENARLRSEMERYAPIISGGG